MYLKSLEMQGFKSFPDKTKLTFEHGATVIVGPNGSGKSNISDAMRWVLGEISSKNLRGSKMEDIIFGGADSRKPMGFAEVSVTFDNTDKDNRLDAPYDEVTVTRRYYRSGESEYFINRQAVRLKDIYELFLNTGIGREGYSIIGQGKIAEIISRKSEDRRNIFEDASGIAKYRNKKNECERKLQATEENMVRINDIFTEISSQIGPLEKESEKAKKAIELMEKKKKADVQLWFFDTERLRKDIDKYDEIYKKASFELSTSEEAIANFENRRDKLMSDSQQNRYESEKLLTAIRDTTDKNHKTESRIEVNNTNAENLKKLISATEESGGSTNNAIENENNQIKERLENIERIKADSKATNDEYSKCEKDVAAKGELIAKFENEIDESFNEIKKLEDEKNQLTIKLSVIENAKKSDSDKNSSIESEMEEYKKNETELQNTIDEIEKTKDGYEKDIKKAEKEIADKTAELDKKEEKLSMLEAELNEKKLRLDTVTQRIETFKAMDEHFEGYNNSVRFVMNAYQEGKITKKDGRVTGKIYGPFTNLLSVDDKYVTALETALGNMLQNIVVEDEEVAKDAMFALKKNEAGRATFLPLTSIKASTDIPEMDEAKNYKGFIDFADKLVDTDKKFTHIVSYAVGRVAVFDNIDNASAMAKDQKYKLKIVTLDGQLINVGGSYTGGSVKQGANLLSRRGEIKRLEEEKISLNNTLESLEEKKNELQKDAEKDEREIQSLSDRQKMVNILLGSENNRFAETKAKFDANRTLIDKLFSDYENIAKLRKQYEADMVSLKKDIAEYDERIKALNEIRNEKNIEKNTLEDEKEVLGKKLTELFIKKSEFQKDIDTENTLIENAKLHIEELKGDIKNNLLKIEEYKNQIETLKALNEEEKFELEKGQKELEELSKKRAELEENSTEFEKKIAGINQQIKEKTAEKDIIFREFTQSENKLNNLKNDYDKLSSKLWDDHELTRAEAMALGYEAIDQSERPSVLQIQTECRNKLRAIGSVDLDAVNKYKEVKERYDYMSVQINDLTASKVELTKIITQLDNEMKSAFVDSFNKINENFNRVFSELFGGGSAELSLSDPDDVLNCGIEIKAAPPGKIIKNMMQLSGGEQAFIAIALFFAILQVNPTPFCILDEIEAALDEVNVSRFSEYIKRYSGDTQFVLITHRRGTMESANRLYGVTMPEHGISKVLTLNVADIAEKKEGDWDGIFGQA